MDGMTLELTSNIVIKMLTLMNQDKRAICHHVCIVRQGFYQVAVLS